MTDDKQIESRRLPIHSSLSLSLSLIQYVDLGYPQPEYRWMKDGTFQTEFSSEPVYKIQSIRREDAGVYQCVARNAVGSIFSEQVQLLVACKLSPFLPFFPPFLLLDDNRNKEIEEKSISFHIYSHLKKKKKERKRRRNEELFSKRMIKANSI